ncbi:MAG TPA: gamma-glutamyl-gamma-aminobutyrate hydrolase family protein [Candidatus Limnocylindria bacterium]|nr:gamma-glutamyl-gamma-aminobutyrate hydrolase family protein [Candidatus Limnocylindria bacterium]
MNPPLILISPSTQKRGVEFEDNAVSLSNQYCLAIAAAGGLPWIAPAIPAQRLVAESVARADGVLLTGGDDVQTELYAPKLNGKLKKTVSEPEPERDLFELMLVEEAFRQRKPLFGICRGLQLLNIAFGGTLIVDIESQIPTALDHRRMDRKNEVVHDAELTDGSLLANITAQKKLGVNSSHHQAIAELAEPFVVTARSEDGVIEGMELKPGAASLPFFLAVQFHPERLYARHKEHLKLFQHFVRAARKQQKL